MRCEPNCAGCNQILRRRIRLPVHSLPKRGASREKRRREVIEKCNADSREETADGDLGRYDDRGEENGEQVAAFDVVEGGGGCYGVVEAEGGRGGGGCCCLWSGG